MKLKVALVLVIIGTFLFACAASMDLRLDTMKSDMDYGQTRSTIEWEDFRYFSGEPERAYKELAKLIVQETPTVIMSRSTDEMLNYMCKKAWENGADAVINVEMTTTNVAGGAARTSPVVKGTAIKYTD